MIIIDFCLDFKKIEGKDKCLHTKILDYMFRMMKKFPIHETNIKNFILLLRMYWILILPIYSQMITNELIFELLASKWGKSPTNSEKKEIPLFLFIKCSHPI